MRKVRRSTFYGADITGLSDEVSKGYDKKFKGKSHPYRKIGYFGSRKKRIISAGELETQEIEDYSFIG